MQTPSSNPHPFVFGRERDDLTRWLDAVCRSDRDARYSPDRFTTGRELRGRYERYAAGIYSRDMRDVA